MPKKEGMIKALIKPKDFDLRNGFGGSLLGKSEKETIACNIVVIGCKAGDWTPFTWEEYQLNCNHSVTNSEQSYLDGFVANGLMKKQNDEYSITDEFIVLLWKFVR
ncbi:MAG TPA: hypothetical protein VE973_00665 [Candidatus Limnocylindria bacterium]|nr:hypothetical protein [Candidatus Limnocylindria bacterium]